MSLPLAPPVSELLRQARDAGLTIAVVEMPMRSAHRTLFYDTTWWAQYVAHVRTLLAPYGVTLRRREPLDRRRFALCRPAPSFRTRCRSVHAVEEYCRYLAIALQTHGIQLEIRRVLWEIHGWPHSLEAPKLMATQWRDTWVLVQYIALAWSRRGFPQEVLLTMKI